MSTLYIGPFCEACGIEKSDLKNGVIRKPVKSLLNGTVIEINYYFENLGYSSNDLFNILVQLEPELKSVNVKSLKTKVSRICEQKKKLSHKKKVAGFKNTTELLIQCLLSLQA